MKTTKTIYIITALLSLNANILLAMDRSKEMNPPSLAPTTPAEATFEETTINMTLIPGLAPVNPAVADFSDNDAMPEPDIRTSVISPVAPKEADFEEVTANEVTTPVIELAPVNPAAADFED